MPTKFFRALTLILILGSGTAVATPSVAQGFSFGFSIGDGFAPKKKLRLCLLTESQLRSRVRDQGYRNIYLNVAIHDRIQVRATKGRWVYLLDVNSCTGRILDRERLRPA